MNPRVAEFLQGAVRDGASEAYAVLVTVDGEASVHVGKARPDGTINYAGASTRGLKLGALLDELLGPLTYVSAVAHMEGYDDLPPEVKALVQEHGPRAHRLYDEGYEAFDILQILKAEKKHV